MKKLILLLIATVTLIRCTSKTTENNDTAVTDITTEAELKAIEQSGRSFYDWYFKNDFPNCEIVKGKNGYCVMDTISYFKTLRNLGTISEQFIRSERDRLQNCAEFIENFEYEEYQNVQVYDPGHYCSYLYTMNWLGSEDPAAKFWTQNVTKINDTTASVAIYIAYDISGNDKQLLSTVFLKKEKNKWMMTEIRLATKDTKEKEPEDFRGSWAGGIVNLYIGSTSMRIVYHEQCRYNYPIKKISDTEFIMIWSDDMDCNFNNRTSETFGLKKVPQIGKPFAKYKIKNNILYAEYYYPEWVNSYTNNVEYVFSEKYFRMERE